MFSDVGGDLTCRSFGSSWSLNAFSKIMVGLDFASDDWLMRPKVGDGPSLLLASDALVLRKFHFLRSPRIMELPAEMSVELQCIL